MVNPSIAGITFWNTFFASSTYFCTGSSGQKWFKINPLTPASFAIIPACSDVKWELISWIFWLYFFSLLFMSFF